MRPSFHVPGLPSPVGNEEHARYEPIALLACHLLSARTHSDPDRRGRAEGPCGRILNSLPPWQNKERCRAGDQTGAALACSSRRTACKRVRFPTPHTGWTRPVGPWRSLARSCSLERAHPARSYALDHERAGCARSNEDDPAHALVGGRKHVLSVRGVTSPVPRESDYGYDLLVACRGLACAGTICLDLRHRIGRVVTAGSRAGLAATREK
jgi:hypothetical protein